MLNVDVKVFDDEWRKIKNIYIQDALDELNKIKKRQIAYVSGTVFMAILFIAQLIISKKCSFPIITPMLIAINGFSLGTMYCHTCFNADRKKHFTTLTLGLDKLIESKTLEEAAKIVYTIQKEMSEWKRSSLWDNFFMRRLFEMVEKLYDAKRVFSETIIGYERDESDLKVIYQDKSGEVFEHKFYCRFQTNKAIDEPRLLCEKGRLILEQNPSHTWKTNKQIKENMELYYKECQNQDASFLYW